jgi:glutamate--cysteine ligase
MTEAALSRTAILEQFHAYGCPRDRFLIGGEYERAIVHKSGKPVSYAQEHGIRWFLQQFSERWGWSPKYEGDNVIALYKDNANITLEPGGQFEISGKPHRDLQTLVEEFEENRHCLNLLASEANLQVITAGLTPITAIEDVDWMPKGRYVVMREYLPQQGDLAHYMMKGTTSVQCNYDFIDEADCANKVRLASALAPLTTAIFANSPLYQNQFTGFQSYRGHIWTRTDPDRTGFPPGLREDFTFERWVDYLLEVPMMFIKRGDNWIHAKGKSFAHFMEHGVEGHFPNWDDWELHMTSTFPEVRIKRTIEVRGADCVSHDLALAFCALFTGLFYDDSALSQGLELAEEVIQYGSRNERFDIACRSGIQGIFQQGSQSISIQKLAERMVSIGQDGLSRYQPHNQYLLDPLMKQVQTGCSPSHNLLQFWHDDSSPENIIQRLAY